MSLLAFLVARLCALTCFIVFYYYSCAQVANKIDWLVVMQCRHSSLELSTSALAFIKSHPLMDDCVDTVDSRPLYFTKHDEAFTRLAVDHVAQYTVFFLASSMRSTALSISVLVATCVLSEHVRFKCTPIPVHLQCIVVRPSHLVNMGEPVFQLAPQGADDCISC